MIEYTVNENLNIAFGGSDAKRVSDKQNSKSFMRLLENNDQCSKSNDSFSESTDGKLMPMMNIQGAFRALEQLALHRQETKQLAEQIIKVYTEMLRVDGACIYKYTTENKLEILACNNTWSNIFSSLQAAEKVDDQNLLLSTDVLLPYHVNLNIREIDQSPKAVPLFLGTRNYGSILSLPLVCDGTTIGVISLFSINSQFFLPEHINELRMIAYLSALLYMNIHMKSILEKEQIERITLQNDVRMLHEQLESHQHNLNTYEGAGSAYEELEALSYSVSHDLRSPIIAVRNNCEWLSTRACSKPRHGRAITCSANCRKL